MINLSLSPRVLNIFYADMFIIKGNGCLIMGSGKSDFGRIAAEKLDENCIGQDTICLSRIDDQLYGHYEMSHVPVNFSPEPKLINTLVRCLSEQETMDIFGDMPKELLIAEYPTFIQLCEFNITFTVDPMGILSERLGDHASDYFDPDSRIDRFVELTTDIQNIEYVVLPWMASAQQKAELLKDFL